MVVLWSFSGSMKRHKITTQHIQVWSGLHNIGRALLLRWDVPMSSAALL